MKRTYQDHPGSSIKKHGKDGTSRRKKNPGKEKQAQAVRKKKVQQTAESPQAETVSLDAKAVKVSPGQTAKWQQLPKSTRLHLDSMMNWLIVSLLYENAESHRETERHLKLLKKRLLKHFETLKVPVEKISYLQNARKILAKNKKQCGSLEEGLAVLQEELDEAAKAATQREEDIQSLHNKIQELKRELIAEGKRASKLFQIDGSDDLDLPKLSKHSIEAPLLQKTFSKIQNQGSVLNYLNSIQRSHGKDRNELKHRRRSFKNRGYKLLV